MDTVFQNDTIILLNFIKRLIYNKDKTSNKNICSNSEIESICIEADKQRLGAILYFYSNANNYLPDKWEIKFSKYFRALSSIELKRSNEFKKILKILNINKIDVVPLKGGALAYIYYPHPALRPMSDLDILVKSESVEKAWQIMLDNGFIPNGEKHEHHMPILISPCGQAVELHFHIEHSMSFPEKYIWEEAKNFSLFNYNVSVLSAELNLLNAIIHALNDNLICGLKVFIDVAYILVNSRPDPEKLEKLAIKLNLHKKLVLFMNIFPDFFPKKYCYKTTREIELELPNARFLVLNAVNIQKLDTHFLMLAKEYSCKKKYEKFYFVLSKLLSVKKNIKSREGKNINFIVFIYCYLKEISMHYMKILGYHKRVDEKSFIKKAGIAQKRLRDYLDLKDH
jgi:hypothetical protein